jgi:hypothetical protein
LLQSGGGFHHLEIIQESGLQTPASDVYERPELALSAILRDMNVVTVIYWLEWSLVTSRLRALPILREQAGRWRKISQYAGDPRNGLFKVASGVERYSARENLLVGRSQIWPFPQAG